MPQQAALAIHLKRKYIFAIESSIFPISKTVSKYLSKVKSIMNALSLVTCFYSGQQGSGHWRNDQDFVGVEMAGELLCAGVEREGERLKGGKT